MGGYELLIRTGGPADAAMVAGLHTHSWRSAYAGIVPAEALSDGLAVQHQEQWTARLSAESGLGADAAALLIAESGRSSEFLGFGYVLPQADGRVLLDNLHVAPGHTGAGIGAALLREARAWVARNHPRAPLYLEVLAENHRAITFYERAGGVRTDTRSGLFPGGGELPEYEYTWARP
ncbi:N-acetyltransferase family protein [Streptomyces sp. TE33382]